MSKEPPGEPSAKPKRFTASDGGRDEIKKYIIKMYDEVASEPLPDDLQKLLEQLDKPVTGAHPGGGPNDA